MSEVPGDNNDGWHSTADPAGRRKIWIAVACVAVAVLVAVGVLYGVSSQSGSSPSTGGSSAPSPTSPSASSTPGETAETPDPAQAEGTTALPSAERVTLAPAPIDQAVEPTDTVAVAIPSIEAVQGEAVAPGEVSGPALRITVRVTNNGAASLPLSSAVVNLYLGTEQLGANPVSQPSGQPFPAELGPGASADGIFVFEAAEDQRSLTRIEVDLDLATPIVIFEGATS